MSMKLKVREHLKTLKDGDKFTIRQMCVKLDVNDSAISNEICGMVPFGALIVETFKDRANNNSTVNRYTVEHANAISAFYLKFPNGCSDAKLVTEKPDAFNDTPRPVIQPKRRTAWEIKIDVMIAKLDKQRAALVVARSVSL